MTTSIILVPLALLAVSVGLLITGIRGRNPPLFIVGTISGGLSLTFFGLAVCQFIIPYHPPRQNTCTQNLNEIGKAFRLYASDWDDTLPTGKTQPRNHQRPGASGASGAPRERFVTAPRPSSNFVEALSPYLEKLECVRSNETVWRCPQVCEKQGLLGGLKHEFPGVTYSMNWYMTGQREESLPGAPNTLLVRELGKPSPALLRPCPTYPPDAQHPHGNGPPVHTFPSEREFGADTVGPAMHSNGSIVLFVDGHAQYRPVEMLSSKLVSEKGHNGSIRWRLGDTKYGRIWITP
jgi:prepilin-type processing-associated H-X9-DG protein